MIKDINNEVANFRESSVESISQLKEVSFCGLKKPIGFLRFNPEPTDNRLSTKLIRYCWYPIQSIDKNTFIIEGNHKVHFSLTDTIVSSEDGNKAFDRFKKNSPVVVSYYKEKQLKELNLKKELQEMNKEKGLSKNNPKNKRLNY